MRGPIVLAMTLLAFVAVVVACTTSYPTCYRGEYQGCFCAPGVPGYQACDVTENSFLACVCDGTTPGIDGGRDTGAADASDAATDPDASGAAYMTPCGPNDACAGAGARCFEFGNKGKVCTRNCTQASDCPPPSLGCSPNQAVCRAP